MVLKGRGRFIFGGRDREFGGGGNGGGKSVQRDELVRRVNAHIQTGHFHDADEVLGCARR